MSSWTGETTKNLKPKAFFLSLVASTPKGIPTKEHYLYDVATEMELQGIQVKFLSSFIKPFLLVFPIELAYLGLPKPRGYHHRIPRQKIHLFWYNNTPKGPNLAWLMSKILFGFFGQNNFSVKFHGGVRPPTKIYRV